MRDADLAEFYALLGRLGTPRRLHGATAKDGWPSHGVYFFFEDGELRTDGSPRVVRVGTHGLGSGSRTKLWQRLAQHRGTLKGSGNHRASIFRRHVGTALIKRDQGSGDLLTAWTGKRRLPEWAAAETEIERQVSEYVGRMRFVCLAVPTEADGSSLRGDIERNSISLLSNRRDPTDRPSAGWLGQYATSEKVRASGLWNINHVDEDYEPEFLASFRALTSR
ncbi:hypothetical protein NQK81_05180 [Amycolatopsis roodepoortensis]|uniref:hypothetical protein n=1 Tax=Amycolatopsis roodepoortensis TaxID=700274 RepID=UPI00214C6635|nr:hypothetical protein [Amycolatopsis roodepoortensis]UUV32851.1 hypothetical protein NQK81_05180 [Amycolatopsis roodepoortensis]